MKTSLLSVNIKDIMYERLAQRRPLDWIEDSIFERNRRLRKDRDVQSHTGRGPNGEITMSWAWAQARKAAAAGQSWLVLTLSGA